MGEGEWDNIVIGGWRVITLNDIGLAIAKVQELEKKIKKLEEDIARISKMLDDIAKKIV
jgi:uncharacterized small protein (DUF1192 family)